MAESESRRRLPLVAYALLAVGIPAVAVGLLWKSIVPDTAFWSEEQAQEYQEAYAAAHEASIHGAAGHGGGGEIGLDEAKANFRGMHQQLTNARQARGVWGKIIAVVGVVLAAAGAWLLRQSDAAG